jgi:hypothetical protein
MDLKAVNVRNRRITRSYRWLLFLAVCLLFSAALSAGALAQAAQNQKTFSAHDASVLLNQMNDGLVTRSAGKFLAAFDLTRMDNGQLFKQQISSFISHTDAIRMHFNLTNSGMNGGQGVASVDVQMEADTGNGGAPLHKEATLNLVAEQAGSAWKFIDLQPRAFFSTSSNSSGTPTPQ